MLLSNYAKATSRKRYCHFFTFTDSGMAFGNLLRVKLAVTGELK